jgi:WD40 repeat protein/serine/threonine protein kinase
LQRYVLGHLEESEADQIQRHLADCRGCLKILQELPADDALAQAVRAQATPKELPYQAAAEQLAARLSGRSASVTERSAANLAAGPHTTPEHRSAVDHAQAFDFLAPPQQPDELGRLASYRVLKVLGQGGMGVVFLAEDPQLQRLVALKTFQSQAAVNDLNRQRFLREARATAGIEHDHIVPIYQVGEAQGVPFLAMQLLKGETLEQHLKRAGRLPISEVMRIGREIAQGLAAAHQRGLVHRDIKPSNIWLEEGSGRVKLVDFGLARGTSSSEHLTQTGFVVGTPAYMAPEQARGQPVDQRCDLFSLGCVLYRMAAGQSPFQAADTLAILTALVTDTPKPLCELNPDVSHAMSDLVMQLLAKDPENRPANAPVVIARLQELEQGSTARLPDISAKRQAGQRVPVPVAAALLMAAVGIGAWFALTGSTSSPSSDRKVALSVEPTAPATTTRTTDPPTDEPPLDPDPDPEAAKAIMKPGDSLSSVLALVNQPARLPRVESWTIETQGHRGPIRALMHSPDGRWLATAGSDGTVRLWDAKSGKLLRILVGHVGEVGAVNWSADSKTLASRSTNIRLWDPETGKCRKVMHINVPGFALAPDGQKLATCGLDKSVKIRDIHGNLLQVLPLNNRNASPLVWSADGTFLAAGTFDRNIYLWARGTKEPLTKEPRILQGHRGPVLALAWSPDGKYLVSGSRDGTLRLWDAQAGKSVRTYPWVAVSKVTGPPTSRMLFWPANGKLFASINADGVQFWDPNSDKTAPVRTISTPGRTLSMPPDGQSVATVGPEAESVQIWNAASKLALTLPGYKHEHSAGVSWSPEGKHLAMRSGSAVHIWDAGTGKLDRTLSGHAHDIAGLAWSPDGKKLATTSGWNSKLLIHDIATGKVLHSIEPKAKHLSHAAWSNDGAFLAVAADQPKDVLLWTMDFTKLPRSLGPFNASVTDLAWQPDRPVLAMSTIDAAVGVKFWDAAAGKEARPPIPAYLKPNGGTAAIVWSPDGKQLATGGTGTEFPVRVFETAKGKMINEFKGQEGRVAGLTWLANGKTLVARGEDTTLRFWNANSGQLISDPIRGWGNLWNFLPERGLLQTGSFPYAVRFREIDSKRPQATLVLFHRGQIDLGLAITPEGHYRASERLEAELVYVVQNEHGQQILSPADFSATHNWKNDPGKVRLVQGSK